MNIKKPCNTMRILKWIPWMGGLLLCFVFVFLFSCSIFADTLSYSDIGWIDYELGGVHSLKIKTGDEYTLSYESDDYFDDIKNVESSDKSVASAYIDNNMFIELRPHKPGKTTLTIDAYDDSITTIYVTVAFDKAKVETTKWIYRYSQNATVEAENVVKGDVICLKIGAKTYKKKINSTSTKKKVKIRISKPGFYGRKYKLTLLRNNKVVAHETDYVYLSDTVHTGDSKQKVRWITGWNDPFKKNYYTYSEQWCYDWNKDDGISDAYLYFRNGRVSGWQIFG